MSEEEKRMSELISSALPDAAPEEAARRVSPWRRAAIELAAGLALSVVILRGTPLEYIMQFFGELLLLSAMRTLRRENPFFALLHLLSIAGTLVAIVNIIFHATLLPFYYPQLDRIMGWCVFIPDAAGICCLLPALRGIKTAAGQRPRALPALLLIIWLAAVILIGEADGLAALLLILAYLVLAALTGWLLYSLGGAGYAVRGARLRISNAALCALLCVLTLACAAAASEAADGYRMEWEAYSAGAEGARARLCELGMPEDMAAALTEEELEYLKDAQYAIIGGDDGFYGDGGDGFERQSFASALLRMPGEEPVWRLIVYFSWDGESPGAAQAWRVFLQSTDREAFGIPPGGTGPFTGRVLCELDGETVAADYYSLTEDRTALGRLGFRGSIALTGRFSVPDGAESCRGYLACTWTQASRVNGRVSVYSLAEYTCTRGWNFPAADAGGDDEGALSERAYQILLPVEERERRLG